MSAQLVASDGLAVHQSGRSQMLSLSDDVVRSLSRIVETSGGGGLTEGQARAIYGFFPYAIDKTVYVSPGEVRFNGAEVGEFQDFAAMTPGYTLSNLTPSSTGVLYLQINTLDSDLSYSTSINSDFAVIGDNGNEYVLQVLMGVYQLQVVTSLEVAHMLQYAAAPPGDLPNKFHKQLATIVVDEDGFPVVTPIHFGTVHVPILGKYKTEVSVGEP